MNRAQRGTGKMMAYRDLLHLRNILYLTGGMMDQPKRIQRKRTKGWKMPTNAVYVGRPSDWGNDFVVGEDGTVDECLMKYRKYFIEPTLQVHGKAYFAPLRGKDLACWCKENEPCHADILLKLANE